MASLNGLKSRMGAEIPRPSPRETRVAVMPSNQRLPTPTMLRARGRSRLWLLEERM